MSDNLFQHHEFSKFSPVYYQLQQALVAKIMDGTWKAGDQIPSEREIAGTYGLSIGTVKKAVLNLVQAGYCYRVQGKGSFVTQHSLDKDFIKYYRLRKNFVDDENVRTTVKFVGASLCTPPQEVRQALNLQDGAECIEITRTFMCNDCCVAYTSSYFDRIACDKLLSLDVSEFESLSLYVLIERHCAIPTLHCDEIIRIVDLPAVAKEFFPFSDSHPVLQVTMIGQTYDFKPYEYRVSYIDTAKYGLCREHVFKT